MESTSLREFYLQFHCLCSANYITGNDLAKSVTFLQFCTIYPKHCTILIIQVFDNSVYRGPLILWFGAVVAQVFFLHPFLYVLWNSWFFGWCIFRILGLDVLYRNIWYSAKLSFYMRGISEYCDFLEDLYDEGDFTTK